MNMKQNLVLATATAALLTGSAAIASSTQLALRLESTSIHNGATSQTIATTFGTNTASLPFSGTTSYDFYSPRLTGAINLHANDHSSGTVYMANTGTNSTDDFTVTGRMRFFDYDPSTGADTLLADTGNSPSHAIKHGKTGNWSLPTVNVLANTTVPAGHQLHINLGIALASGNAAGIGQFLIDGPSGSSTLALLPQDNSVTWNFAPPGVLASVAPMTSVSLSRQADGSARLSCSTAASQTYSVQATTSLASPAWVTIGTASADGSGAFSFMDLDAPNYPARFYRLAGP
jgi:hypothetical protein